jgi:hypothetical protein
MEVTTGIGALGYVTGAPAVNGTTVDKENTETSGVNWVHSPVRDAAGQDKSSSNYVFNL